MGMSKELYNKLLAIKNCVAKILGDRRIGDYDDDDDNNNNNNFDNH
jgi:hypothetical protein